MPERPYSRYTRAKTWAALYSQHIDAGYALVPYSKTINSIIVIRCESATEADKLSRQLVEKEEDLHEFYRSRRTLDHAPKILRELNKTNRLRIAVVLARSSDYYHYSIEDRPAFRLVICGLHDSYLHIPVLEMRSNKRYKARETAVAITDPDFNRIRKNQFGHNILVAALAKGNQDAIAFVERKNFPERTRSRLYREKDAYQDQHYHGRPLSFMSEEKRQTINAKIRESMKHYHAKKRLGVEQ